MPLQHERSQEGEHGERRSCSAGASRSTAVHSRKAATGYATVTPGAGASRTPLQSLEGTITPNGLHFERHHNGVPDIDPERHHLLIHGLVNRPLTFSVAALSRYPMVSRVCFVECAGNSRL